MRPDPLPVVGVAPSMRRCVRLPIHCPAVVCEQTTRGAGDDDKTRDAGRAFHDLDCRPIDVSHSFVQRAPGISPICEDMGQGGVAFERLHDRVKRSITVLNIGGVGDEKSGFPSVSVATWRFRPFVFLPALYPRGPPLAVTCSVNEFGTIGALFIGLAKSMGWGDIAAVTIPAEKTAPPTRFLLTPLLGLLVYTFRASVTDPMAPLGNVFARETPYFTPILGADLIVLLAPGLATLLPNYMGRAFADVPFSD